MAGDLSSQLDSSNDSIALNLLTGQNFHQEAQTTNKPACFGIGKVSSVCKPKICGMVDGKYRSNTDLMRMS